MRFKSERKPGIDFELIGLSLGAVFLPALIIWLKWFKLPLPQGKLKKVWDIPCAFCGGTRSFLLLIEGNFAAAFSINPLAAAGLLTALVLWIYALVVTAFNLPRIRIVDCSTNEIRLFTALALIVLLANWSYIWIKFN